MSDLTQMADDASEVPAGPGMVEAARVPGGEVDQPLRSLDVLHNVEMAVTVELGHARMLMRDLLGLRPGRVIELDRAVGSPVDILVNNTLLARGEVVVVDDELGVRLTEIVGPAEGALGV